jgi:hypothetical protein
MAARGIAGVTEDPRTAGAAPGGPIGAPGAGCYEMVRNGLWKTFFLGPSPRSCRLRHTSGARWRRSTSPGTPWRPTGRPGRPRSRWYRRRRGVGRGSSTSSTPGAGEGCGPPCPRRRYRGSHSRAISTPGAGEGCGPPCPRRRYRGSHSRAITPRAARYGTKTDDAQDRPPVGDEIGCY